MMKQSDIKVAIALLIGGYLRANEEHPDSLRDCVRAIVGECSDWCEGLPQNDWDIAMSFATRQVGE